MAFPSLWRHRRVPPVSFPGTQGRDPAKQRAVALPGGPGTLFNKHQLVLPPLSQPSPRAHGSTSGRGWQRQAQSLHPQGKSGIFPLAAGGFGSCCHPNISKLGGQKSPQKPHQSPKSRNKLVSSFFCSLLLSPFCNIISVSRGSSRSLFVIFLRKQWGKCRTHEHGGLHLHPCVHYTTTAHKFCFLLP